jgi:hypothetical protein
MHGRKRRMQSASAARRFRFGLVGLAAAFALIVGQIGLVIASADTSRDRSAGTISNTTIVGGKGTSGGSTGSAVSTHTASSAPLAGGSGVQVKFFGQDPTSYDHTTGVGGNSNDATETELEAEDFECGDKVAFYALLEAPSGLTGSNTITAALDFSKHTSSNDPFGFSAGVSFALEGGGVTTSDGGESLAGSGGFGSTADDITLSFQVSDVEANEVIAVRVLVVLGNCGPGTFTGNVPSSVNSCSPVAITTCGNQTVTLKFKGTLGTIQVVKDLNPSTDPGSFNLRIGGTTFATGGDGADTGALGFLPGTYTVDETAANAATNLADYTTTISCQNGAQPAVVTNGTTTDVILANGDAWVCTISNTVKPAAPELTIIKTVVNDDGGTAVSSDFTMQVTATNPSQSSFPGADTPGVTITLDAGTYSVTETGPGGYAASFSADCTGSIAAGDHKFCTITNDDIAPTPPPPGNPPGIVIVKGGPALAHVGDTITYTFAVSLVAGSPSLSNVTVVDPICNSAPVLGSKTGGDLDNTLESGETWNYTCTHVVTATDPDPLPNTATASGTDSRGTTVSDQDSHVVDLIHPAIEIIKSAKPQQGSPGDTIVYTYNVTNVGDVDLVNISVDDNVIGHICDIPLLHPGDSATCTASFVIPTDANIEIENVGVAIGEDVLGVPVRDEDTARITVVLGATITPPTKTPPGGVAFTGTAAVVPLTGVALLLFLVGSGLLWAGRRRGDNVAGTEQ